MIDRPFTLNCGVMEATSIPHKYIDINCSGPPLTDAIYIRSFTHAVTSMTM